MPDYLRPAAAQTVQNGPQMILKLGTRRSLLALAQSNFIARQLECHNPGLTVELIGIDTLNDRSPAASLHLIDEALLSGRVDFTVHAMKDVGFERPSEIKLGAIPRREDPRDVVLFHGDVLERLRQGLPLRIGGSSPRRLENVPQFLERALPRQESAPAPRLRWAEARGGVDERLRHLKTIESNAAPIDALVFAFAALIGLWRDSSTRARLAPLLHGLRWMVLPLTECPGAPGQGALALECRSSDGVTLPRLKRLHDSTSARLVSIEREVLHHWNEADPQRFGAAALATNNFGDVLFLKGLRPDGAPLSEVWPHSRPCPERLEALRLSPTRLWTSDANQWAQIAEHGLWVEGCADGLGFAATRSTREELALFHCNGP